MSDNTLIQERGQERDERDVSSSVAHNTDEERKSAIPSEDVSVFSAVRELLFTSFCDGYCKGTFCFDSDCFFPSTPYYRNYLATDDEGDEEFTYIDRTSSAASSSAVSRIKSTTRQRPLAVAVGFDSLKDLEGRQVVITPARKPPPKIYHQSNPLRGSGDQHMHHNHYQHNHHTYRHSSFGSNNINSTGSCSPTLSSNTHQDATTNLLDDHPREDIKSNTTTSTATVTVNDSGFLGFAW